MAASSGTMVPASFHTCVSAAVWRVLAPVMLLDTLPDPCRSNVVRYRHSSSSCPLPSDVMGRLRRSLGSLLAKLKPAETHTHTHTYTLSPPRSEPGSPQLSTTQKTGEKMSEQNKKTTSHSVALQVYFMFGTCALVAFRACKARSGGRQLHTSGVKG